MHRDLKPANLFITHRADGTPLVKVLDFGISSGVELTIADGSPDRAPVQVHIMGSPPTWRPSRCANFEAVDARADIWSLGAILYELLTNEMIHDERSIGVLLAKIATCPSLAHAPTARSYPRISIPFVLRCLERNPDRRIQDVQELACALLPFASARSRPCVARILGERNRF